MTYRARRLKQASGYVRLAMLALLMPAAAPPTVSAGGAEVAIRWRTGAHHAARQAPARVAAAIEALRSPARVRHVVVQFDRAITPAERAAVADAGVTLLSYLGDNAFFASVSPTGVDRAALAAMDGLADATPIETAWKLHPLLVAGVEPTWATVGADARGDPIVGVYVVFHPDVPVVPNGADVVGRHGGAVRAALWSVNGLVVELPLRAVTALAAEDAVEYIEPALPRWEGLNSENRALVGADTVQAPPFDLDGSGVTVLVYDAGRAMNDSGIPHPDVSGRLTLGDAAPPSPHAAHVTCTVGGDGSQSVGLVHRGMAPGVDLVSYGFQWDGTNIFLYTNPGDLEADYSDAITVHGADIANNSIGTNTCSNGFPCAITGDYGVTSALIDAIVGGSLGAPFRVVFANGNERACGFCPNEHQNGYHSTAPPACAKNHITVGAVYANDDTVTSFTSWGPTDDGRLKPDIVAPGCQIGGDAGVTSCNTGFGVFGYTSLCGTSMAAPTVTGLAALLMQDFRAQFPLSPDFRNATLKVLLAHNAVDIANPGPDYQSGYGSVRIEPTVNFMRTGAFLEDQVDHGETFSILVMVEPGDPQLKVTLAWDDVPGTPNVDPALVNDLDLRVFDPADAQLFPWTLDPQNPALPAVQTQADHVNNIEQVVINAPAAGVYRVEVHGFNVPSGPQVFSIAGSPVLLVPNSGTLTPTTATLPIGAAHTLTAGFREGTAPFDPIAGVMVTFEVVAGPNLGVLGTGVTDVTGSATLTYTGADLAGTDQIRASFDDAGVVRFSNIAIANWVPGHISLSPDGTIGNVATDHTVTADVTQDPPPGSPLAGRTVTFDVLTGPNAGVTGTAVTDVGGVATFTYTGADLAGTDEIRASFVDGGQTQLSDIVTHTWLPGQITLTPTTSTLNECNDHVVTADVILGAPPSTPITGTVVTFQVVSGPNAGTVGNGVTDVNGQATLSYTGGGGPGTDQVQASFFDASATQLSNTVTVTWLPSPLGLDCNINGTPDECEVGWDQDCNVNGVADLCDLAPVLAFAAPTNQPTATDGAAIGSAELDGLPGPDLFVASAGQKVVTVLLNNGDGTFAVPVNYDIDKASEAAVAADFNGDGHIDIAAATKNDTVSVLINNGDGTFVPGGDFVTLGDRPSGVATADLDGINGPDLVVVSRNGDPGVPGPLSVFIASVMLNDGTGAFPTVVKYTVGDTPEDVQTGDLDGVNGPDVVVANKQADTVSVLLNNGDGTLAPAATYAIGNGPLALAITDIDGDLDLDLASVASGSSSVTTLANNGDGTFSLAGGVSFGVGPVSLAAADLDDDGDQDLVGTDAGTFAVPGTTILVLLNHGDGTFAPITQFPTAAASPVAVVVEDVDQDGRLDVSTAHALATGDVSVLMNQVARFSVDCNGNGIPDDCEPDSDGDGVPDACDPCVGGSCIDVTVQLDGLAVAGTRDVTFVVTDCNLASELTTTSITFDASGQGTVSLGVSLPNATWISADEAHTLRRLLPLAQPLPASVSFTGSARLLPGDVTADQWIDVEDLSVLASAWDLPGVSADVNGDGLQNTIDAQLIVDNRFTTGDAVDGCPPPPSPAPRP